MSTPEVPETEEQEEAVEEPEAPVQSAEPSGLTPWQKMRLDRQREIEEESARLSRVEERFYGQAENG